MEHLNVPAPTPLLESALRARILLLLAGLLMCSAVLAEGPRIGGSGWVVDAPTKIAQAEGFFVAAGVPEARVFYYDSGRDALAGLLAGEVDFAMVAPLPVARALLAADDGGEAGAVPAVKVLASVGLSNQSHYLLTHRRAEVGVPQDLAGHRIGMPLGTSAHFAWSMLAQSQGLGADDVELVDVAPTEHAAALVDGRVDAVMTWDPYGQLLVEQLGDRVSLFSTRALHSVNWLLVTTQAHLEKHPDWAAMVVDGYLRAVDLIHGNPHRARAIHADATGLPVRTLIEMEDGVFWKVTLNWSVMTNLDAVLRWQQARSQVSVPLPAPAHYLSPGVLGSLRPEAVVLPAHVLRSLASDGRLP